MPDATKVNREAHSFPRVLRWFFIVVLVANSIAICCEIAGHARHLGYPYNSPLLPDDKMRDPRVPDLLNYAPLMPRLHTAEFFSFNVPAPFMYPAPVAPLYRLFLSFPHPVAMFRGVMVLSALLPAILFGAQLRRRGRSIVESAAVPAALLLLSYPLWFELKQGNMEIFVCLLLGAGVWCFVKDKLYIAAILFGIAAAMKLFPVIYLGLFLSRKRYRPLLSGLGTAVAVSLLCLAYVGPTVPIATRGVLAGLALYSQKVVLVVRSKIGFDHTLLGLLKVLAFGRHGGAVPPAFHSFVTAYMAAVVLIITTLFFVRIRFMPALNQVLTVCVVSIVLTPVSYDYTLLHLYIPLGMLILLAYESQNNFTPGLTAAMVCLALATSAETELIRHQQTYGGQFKALVMLCLLAIALRYRFEPVSRLS